MYSEETKTEKETCIPLFTAALYTIECYLAMKRNKSESVLVRWMNLKPVIQNEVSQKEKNKYHILIYIYMEYRKMVLMDL